LDCKSWLFFSYEAAPWVGTRNKGNLQIKILHCRRISGNVVESNIQLTEGCERPKFVRTLRPTPTVENLFVTRAGWTPSEFGLKLDTLVFNRGIFAERAANRCPGRHSGVTVSLVN
jgi:hypothetical protein